MSHTHLPQEMSRKCGLVSLADELISKIVRADLSDHLVFYRRHAVPANIWNAIYSIQRSDFRPLAGCLSRASPHRRKLSDQACVCSLRESEIPGHRAPILFSLSQVSRAFRNLLLRDWNLWLGVMLLRPAWIPLIVERVPSSALFDFTRAHGICQHVIGLVYPYLSRARAIDIVLPSCTTDQPTISTAAYLATRLIHADHLTTIKMRSDASGPAVQCAHTIVELRCLQEVYLFNSDVAFVGPQVRELSMINEGNPGTQWRLGTLLSALAICRAAEYLRLQCVLRSDIDERPWEWPVDLRPTPRSFPKLQKLICHGTRMEPLALLYGLDVPDTVEIHWDMAARLVKDTFWHGDEPLRLPTLGFVAPARARELVDRAWEAYHDEVLAGLLHAEFAPVMNDMDETAGLPDGWSVAYPRTTVLGIGDCDLDDFMYGHLVETQPDRECDDEIYSIIGIGIGARNISRVDYPDAPSIPDYVTLVAAAQLADVLDSLEYSPSNRPGSASRCRSLTLHHVATEHEYVRGPVDVMGNLVATYAQCCRAAAVEQLVIGSSPSVEVNCDWYWLELLPNLRRVDIEVSITARGLLALAENLQYYGVGTKLALVSVGRVTRLAEARFSHTSALLERLSAIVGDRPHFEWEFRESS
ncbi:unnamed protein product [Peniophora sp. CBMAI 1063]|nr:unnamed protein product [Peniophora sp. CBMAI 1063]